MPKTNVVRIEPRIVLPHEVPQLPTQLPRPRYIGNPPVPFGFVVKDNGQAARVGYANERSMLLIAPPGTGKSVRVLFHTALSYPDMVVFLDSKGEFAAVSARYRASLGRVVIINPFRQLWDIPHMRQVTRINPLAQCNPRLPDFTTRIGAIADCIIWQSDKDAYFTQGSRFNFRCVAEAERYANPNATLGDVYDRLMLARIDWLGLMSAYCHSPSANARQLAQIYLGGEEKSIWEQRSDAKTQLGNLLDDAQVRDCLSANEFDWSELKGESVISVYIVLPANEGKNLQRFARLVLGGMANALAKPPRRPCLVVLDEVATALSERELREVEGWFNGLRGMGVRCQAVFQSWGQVAGIFKERAEALAAGAGLTQFLRPNNEVSTVERIVKLAGEQDKVYWSSSISSGVTANPAGGASRTMNHSLTEHRVKTNVLDAVALRNMHPNGQIVFIEGSGYPMVLWNLPYTDPRAGLQGRYDANPFAPGYVNDNPAPPEALLPESDLTAYQEALAKFAQWKDEQEQASDMPTTGDAGNLRPRERAGRWKD